MAALRIGLLSKKRGNFVLQEKFRGPTDVWDTTEVEVAHHRAALVRAGYPVRVLPWGEDLVGRIQSGGVDLVFNVSSLAEAELLEDLDVPFVGSATGAIAASLDKPLAKRLWARDGLPTAPFVVAEREEDCLPFRDEPPIPFPLFVKPARGRGCVGVDETSIVADYEQLTRAVAHRLLLLEQPVIIEKYLEGREIALGILGNDPARVLPPLEIVRRDGEVTLSFENKELDANPLVCPASLSREETRRLSDLALSAYHALGLRDYGRVDFILTSEGPLLLEANAFAGLMCTPRRKPHSYIGVMAKAEGMDGRQLLGEIVRHATQRLGLAA